MRVRVGDRLLCGAICGVGVNRASTSKMPNCIKYHLSHARVRVKNLELMDISCFIRDIVKMWTLKSHYLIQTQAV